MPVGMKMNLKVWGKAQAMMRDGKMLHQPTIHIIIKIEEVDQGVETEVDLEDHATDVVVAEDVVDMARTTITSDRKGPIITSDVKEAAEEEDQEVVTLEEVEETRVEHRAVIQTEAAVSADRSSNRSSNSDAEKRLNFKKKKIAFVYILL